MQALKALGHSLVLFISTLTKSVKITLTPIRERVVNFADNISSKQILANILPLIVIIFLTWLLAKIVRHLFANLKLLIPQEKLKIFLSKIKNHTKSKLERVARNLPTPRLRQASKKNLWTKFKKILETPVSLRAKKSEHNFELASREQKQILIAKQRTDAGHLFVNPKYPTFAIGAILLFATLAYTLPEKYQLANLAKTVETRFIASRDTVDVNQDAINQDAMNQGLINQGLMNQTPTGDNKILAKSSSGQEMVLAATTTANDTSGNNNIPLDPTKKTVTLTGVLTDNTGNPVDGDYEIRFVIYTVDRTELDPYPSDTDQGKRIWQENQTVTIKKGIFNVSLGAVTDLPVFTTLTDTQFYVGMRIGTDSEMAPRRKVSTPFFSLNSANALLLNGKKVGITSGDIVALDAQDQVDINNLPTGTGTNQLVLGNDKRLKTLTVSGASFLTISGQTVTANKIKLTTDTQGILS
ncbi:MAG: hypothetical protein NTY33_03180, partial [Candidatus Moranbacteria bacterium]|nr:hypothetical protein [Candidatus Moranbacteria bacterium]